MPSWIVTWRVDKEGKILDRMPGVMGPYTKFNAIHIADKLETPHEIVDTVSRDPVRAKRELKEKLVREHGYMQGSKRMHSTDKDLELEYEI